MTSLPPFTVLGMEFKVSIEPNWTPIEGLIIVKAVTDDAPYPLYAFRTTPGLSLPEAIGMMEAYVHDLKVQFLESGKDQE